uniref:ABC transporter domain-containing protein n=1 Tax=Helicotheca tamesis TaxID=374047 RepID=A0A7S2HZM2_9STRA
MGMEEDNEVKKIKRLIQLHAFFTAVCAVSAKWLYGALIGKVIEEATGSTLIIGNSVMFEIVFLHSLTFTQVAIVTAVDLGILSVCFSYRNSLSLVYSSMVGKELRGRILLECADSNSFNVAEDASIAASDLVLKVQTVEQFKADYEHQIFYDTLVVAISFVLTFVFTWVGGLVATVSLLLATVIEHFFKFLRKDSIFAVEANKREKNARLLDVVKNGVRMKMMKMKESEHQALDNLHSQANDARKHDARLFFWENLICDEIINNVPLVTAVASLPLIRNADSVEEAADIGFGILVAMLLLDECHKSLLKLKFTAEKKDRAREAMTAIERHIGEQERRSFAESLLKSREKYKNKLGPENDLDEIECAPDNLASKETTISDVEAPYIGLSDVTFQYPSADERVSSDVISNFSMQFLKGQVHALTGESGSGKSTALKLLVGLLGPPDHGQVNLGGIKNIAYVAQDQHLFARSIRENISYGAIDSSLCNDDERLWQGLRKAKLDSWVHSLEFGLDTVLDSGESEVSGGQLQRLLLAHLFLTGYDAELVILDECLSAVDHLTRDALINELGSFLKGKTCIMITHHSELMKICDDEFEMPKDVN